MSYRDWYTINEAPGGFVCVATDADGEVVKQYGITTEGDMAGICGCLVGHTWCRHKKMLTMFQKEKRVGSRWYYNYDRKRWRAPPKESEA